jgi:RNA polymerase sigma-70 factor (ECF subfamily)
VQLTPSNPQAFERLVAPLRGELHAYCYRMLGSLQDAEDALQEALVGAWQGLAGFEGRSSFRSWLYRVATHACLRFAEQRPKRVLPEAYSEASAGVELAAMVLGPVWLEPYPDPVGASYELRESVELAFVAALQHLPATQRAALILSEVLGFTAAEVAGLLETSVAAISSALQRARETLERQVPATSQQATLKSLGADAERALVSSFVSAWGRGDVAGIIALLARDARFSMPPIPNWFHGHDAIARFLAERVFATEWRLVPLRASGQLAFACYQGPTFHVGALNVVTLRDRHIYEMTGFLDPAVHAFFGLPHR